MQSSCKVFSFKFGGGCKKLFDHFIHAFRFWHQFPRRKTTSRNLSVNAVVSVLTDPSFFYLKKGASAKFRYSHLHTNVRATLCSKAMVTVKGESPTDSSGVRTRKPETCAITSCQKSLLGIESHKTTVIVKHDRVERERWSSKSPMPRRRKQWFISLVENGAILFDESSLYKNDFCNAFAMLSPTRPKKSNLIAREKKGHEKLLEKRAGGNFSLKTKNAFEDFATQVGDFKFQKRKLLTRMAFHWTFELLRSRRKVLKARFSFIGIRYSFPFLQKLLLEAELLSSLNLRGGWGGLMSDRP